MVKSKRIYTLATLVKGYDIVLDIGTDHGLVLKEALDQQWIKAGIASDLRPAPLHRAKKNLEGYPMTYILSDGFLNIKQPFDAVIIAGMGSYLIAEIMKHAPKTDVLYVLQANDKVEALRLSLMQQGFMIIDEDVVYEGHDYIILTVKRGHMSLSESDLLLGPKLRYKVEAKRHYEHQVQKIERFIDQVDEQRKAALIHQMKIYRQT